MFTIPDGREADMNRYYTHYIFGTKINFPVSSFISYKTYFLAFLD